MFQSSAPENRFNLPDRRCVAETHATQETVAERVLATGRACRIALARTHLAQRGTFWILAIATCVLNIAVADDDSVYATSRNRTTAAATKGANDGSPVALDLGVIEHIGPAGLKTYRWDFSRQGDTDFDRWPDRFTRHFNTGFPEYVRIGIVPRDSQLEAKILSLDTALVLKWPGIRRFTEGFPFADKLPPLPPSLTDALIDRCLQVQLDGGQARVLSPELPTSHRFQYRFSVDVLTKDLVHDSVDAQVIFTDASGNELQRRKTPAVTDSPQWRTLSIDSLVPPPGAHSMRVSLNVMGGEDGLQDIRGVISFDNITFRQFPQMKILTDKPFGIYRRGEQVMTTTELLGLPDEPTRVRLRLLDHDDRELRSQSTEVSVREITNAAQYEQPTDAPESGSDRDRVPADLINDDAVSFKWAIEGLSPGYYQVAATMENDRGASLANHSTFVVIDRLTDDPREWSPPPPNQTEGFVSTNGTMPSLGAMSVTTDPLPFGWTLPPELLERYGRGQVSDKAISHWLRSVGVGWAKLPVWFDPDDVQSADAAANLAFRLKDFGIEPVGLLDRPRDDQVEKYRLRERGDSGVAGFLYDSAIWREQLDTIMNRMTFRLRRWQLGDDDDFSFQSRPELPDRLSEIAIGLQGFGQPLELMIPWNWLDRRPVVSGESWKGIVRHTDQTLTADELGAMLALHETSIGGAALVPRSDSWMTIDPLPRERYDRDTRIRDLVLRMATMRGHDVEAAFARRPMSPESTLVTPEGNPDQLLLAWRTSSILLGRARNIGSLRLRNQSHNIVFRSSHCSVILIWADKPRTERLFLGDNVFEVDVWGRRTELPTEQVDGRMVHRVDTNRLPKFLVGIDPALAEFRMSVELDRKRIDSLLGQEQTIEVQYKNPIGQSLVGMISVGAPPAWTIQPDEKEWNLNPLEKGQTEFTVVLGNNATIGQFELPIVIDFASVPPTSIRVYRNLDVGPEGFDLVVTTRLLGGPLRVKIEMTNKTRRSANFDCLLFAGVDRQYERRVLVVGPGETAERNIDWPDGGELVGKRLLLRAIEQGGARVINHTFEVVP